MMPLQWPNMVQQPAQCSWIQRLFTRESHYVQVFESLKRQLSERPQPDPRIWGDDPLRIKIGSLLSRCAMELHSWPNSHFLSEDPFDIVFLTPWDDLEIVEMVMQLEEDLDIKIHDAEVESWAGKTLSQVVSRLSVLCRSQSAKTGISAKI